MTDKAEEMSAIISACGAYRYRLERLGTAIPEHGVTGIIMVNPSTADATNNDATIRKLLGFATWHGWGRLIVGNLFAYRSTDVKELAKAPDPIGPENDDHLRRIMADANRLIFAWGPSSKLPKRLRARWRKVYEMALEAKHEPMSIGKPAKDGHPCHPLMLRYELKPQPWRPAI